MIPPSYTSIEQHLDAHLCSSFHLPRNRQDSCTCSYRLCSYTGRTRGIASHLYIHPHLEYDNNYVELLRILIHLQFHLLAHGRRKWTESNFCHLEPNIRNGLYVTYLLDWHNFKAWQPTNFEKLLLQLIINNKIFTDNYEMNIIKKISCFLLHKRFVLAIR